MGMMLYDSTFFVDLDRERRSGHEGAAHAFLQKYAKTEIALSVINMGELARGFSSRAHWEDFCRGIHIIPLDDEILWEAAKQFQYLRKSGTPISDNDLWIGATAIAHDLALVTENVRHLSKMRNIKLIRHRN